METIRTDTGMERFPLLQRTSWNDEVLFMCTNIPLAKGNHINRVSLGRITKKMDARGNYLLGTIII